MAKKITYAEIGQIIGKNEQTIKGYKQSNPELLKVLKLGARAHLNNIDDKKLELFAELLEKLGGKERILENRLKRFSKMYLFESL